MASTKIIIYTSSKLSKGEKDENSKALINRLHVVYYFKVVWYIKLKQI